MDDTTLSSHPGKFAEDIHEAATSQTDNEDQQIINPVDQFNSDDPLNLHFEEDIADRQRKQYESDMDRKKSSNGLSTGGVFLRASNLDGTILYPTLEVIH